MYTFILCCFSEQSSADWDGRKRRKLVIVQNSLQWPLGYLKGFVHFLLRHGSTFIQPGNTCSYNLQLPPSSAMCGFIICFMQRDKDGSNTVEQLCAISRVDTPGRCTLLSSCLSVSLMWNTDTMAEALIVVSDYKNGGPQHNKTKECKFMSILSRQFYLF